MSGPYYQDEHVTLHHGDCREVRAWLAADAMVTDPPYGLGQRMTGGPEWGQLWSEDKRGARPLEWDSEAPLYVPDLVTHFAQAICWGGNYFALPPSRGWLVWDKVSRNFTGGHCELAWTSLDQPVRAFNFARLNGNVSRERKWHPTQKPLPLMQWCLGFTTGTVADPFAGSGSTLIAARNLGRKAIGVEIDEGYCEVIAKRLDQGCFDFGEGA